MNRKILLGFCLFFLLLCWGISVWFPEPVKADAGTWTVDDDGPADFHAIQEAINAASDGDTILVKTGTYYGKVVVNKSLSLVGENKYDTIIAHGMNVVHLTANNINMTGFTIEGMFGRYYTSNILVDHSSGNNISHNILLRNDVGIDVLYSNNNIISGNDAEGYLLCGISLRNSGHNMVVNNTVLTHPKVMGIWVRDSSDNIIARNTISGYGDYGIRFSESGTNWIVGNEVSVCEYGIFLRHNSDNNTIVDNRVSNNNCGINITSDDNVIYYNEFFDNTLQVYVASGHANVWDNGYPSGGNYWSHYNNADLYNGINQDVLGSDGIGDAPCIICENNRDNYPLIGMFSDFEVTLEEETYHVTTVCNSTISTFKFDLIDNIISFKIAGEYGTIGFCRICIPHALIYEPYAVLVDNEPPLYVNYTLFDNGTHRWIYFSYEHSTKQVIIIPEFSLALILSLFITVTLFTVAAKKRKLV